MAYKDFKSMFDNTFVVYNAPKIKEEKSELTVPEFNRWNYLQDLMITLPKQKEVKEETKQEKSEVQPVYDNQVEENPWVVEGNTKITRARKVNNSTGYKQFQAQLDEYFNNHPEDSGYRDMLTNIAAMESSFNQHATNKWSSALGYFQFVDGTRKQYNTMSREDFSNDAQAQIQTAIAHLKDLKDGIQRNVDTDTITKSGLTPLQIMYGMWWRPKSMYNYLYTGKDSFSTKDGMNIKKILEKAS